MALSTRWPSITNSCDRAGTLREHLAAGWEPSGSHLISFSDSQQIQTAHKNRVSHRMSETDKDSTDFLFLTQDNPSTVYRTQM